MLQSLSITWKHSKHILMHKISIIFPVNTTVVFLSFSSLFPDTYLRLSLPDTYLYPEMGRSQAAESVDVRPADGTTMGLGWRQNFGPR